VSHCEPETLALRALGEPAGSTDDDAHLTACDRCRAELASLRATVDTGRALQPEDVITPPAPQVWQRIADTLELDPSVRPASVGPRPVPVSGERLAAPSAGPAPSAAGAGARPARRLGLVAAALGAAAGLVVGIGGTLMISDENTSDRPGATVVARADLEPLPDKRAAGVAQVIETTQGRSLSVEVTGLTATSGYYEVWLLDADAKRLVSIGLLGSGEGSFVLPADLDLGDFPVVDISLEPFDGDPAHSTDSVVRGLLQG